MDQDVSSIDITLDLLDNKATQIANNGNNLQNKPASYSALRSGLELGATYMRSSMAQASAADLEELALVHKPLGSLEHPNETPGIETVEYSTEKRRRIDLGFHEIAQPISSYRGNKPHRIQITDVVSPLTLLERPPTAIRQKMDMRYSEAIGDRPGIIDSQPQQFPTKDLKLQSDSQSSSEYRFVQAEANMQCIPPELASTAQLNALYNSIQTPKVNSHNEVFHEFQCPVAYSNKEHQDSCAQYHDDRSLILAQQTSNAQQASGIATAEGLCPCFMDIENIPRSMHHNQDSVRSLTLEQTIRPALDKMSQCFSRPHKGDQYRNRYLNAIYNSPGCSTVRLDKSSVSPYQLCHLNDGELDNQMTQVPASQPAPGISISSIRSRITLTPRGPSKSCTPRPRTGISVNIRSSTSITPLPHINSRVHREQLGTVKSQRVSSMSPYFPRQPINSTSTPKTISQIVCPKALNQIHGSLEGPNFSTQLPFHSIDISPVKHFEIQASLHKGQVRSRAELRKLPSSVTQNLRRARR